MYNPDPKKLFNSGKHWNLLSTKEKSELNEFLINSGEHPSPDSFILNEQGIHQGRYPIGHKADIDPPLIKDPLLKKEDAVLLINTVPKNIEEFVNNHNEHTAYKNRFFGEFIKALKTIDSFKKIT